MPPPTANDPWLTSRRFGVVIDAGSSGSRLQIYSWKDAQAVRSEQDIYALNYLPKVEKGTQDEDWTVKTTPGLSSFGDNIDGIATYLAPLLEHARTVIPPSLQPETPLFLLATAGMRLLPPEQQAEVLQATCHFLKFHSHFRIDDASPAGPCGSSVRIITGEEEGLFGWIAINYLMDSFTGQHGGRSTYGFLDMGGASTQIAFEPDESEQSKAQNLIDVRLRLLDGQEAHHKVFVTTWLGYGTNQARERYVDKAISDFGTSHSTLTSSPISPESDVVLDPCLPKDLRITETASHLQSLDSQTNPQYTLLGTGSFEQCLQQTSHLLNKDAPCPDTNCLFNGVYVPPINFSVSHFIGVSEYWYSSEDVFDLGGAYNFVQYERAASEFCARDWADIVQEHERSRQEGTLGGDGEVLQDGEVVATGKWGPQVEIPRLEMQCFKAAWIVNVLHEGLGMPRIVDPGGNSTTDGEEVVEMAEEKGLGPPTFQSMDSVGDIAISWTLGKMVLEASKEVPAASPSSPPLADPLDNSPAASNPVPPPPRPPFLDFDFDAIEDQLSHHLPPSLSRESLGFSLVAFLFYVFVVMFVAILVHRLRHRFRSSIRRFWGKRGRSYITEDYSMEEGQALVGGSSPPSRWPSSPRVSLQLLQPLGRLSGSFGRKSTRPPPISTHGQSYPSQSSPNRASPSRSYSLPVGKPGYGLSVPDSANGQATAVVPGSPRCGDGNIVSNGSVSSLTSRSRNSSQMNITSLMSRQPSGSRTSSGSHISAGSAAFFRDD